jgi:hypothetical protein
VYKEILSSDWMQSKIIRSTDRFVQIIRSTDQFIQIIRSTDQFVQIIRSTDQFVQIIRSTDQTYNLFDLSLYLSTFILRALQMIWCILFDLNHSKKKYLIC